jgi:UDP-N-acetylmuramoyl-L-alanyl-D-glutamate--2,6-diaminopimelate ligase
MDRGPVGGQRPLRALLAGVGGAEVRGDPLRPVAGLAYDSRRVRPGDLFATWQGFEKDGHAFVPEAVAAGAVACLVERRGVVPPEAVEVYVPDSRRALSRVAANFYGHPTRSLHLVGVTGTKGKTTTTYLCREVLGTLGPVGLVGTVQTIVGGQPRIARGAHLTTPEAPDLHAAFAEMVAAGDRYCVIEASSLALARHRVDDCLFRTAVFTNLSHDHIGGREHPDLESYRAAKERLFRLLDPAGHAVVNADDPAAGIMIRATAGEVTTYGLQAGADVRAEDIAVVPGGASFSVVHAGRRRPVRLRLTGRFNVYNALAAYAVGITAGADPDAAVAALERVSGVPGRFQVVPSLLPFSVIVDYAHTPDSLQNVLGTAREFARGRVIAVFGAGGDRDRGKRPRMGAIAAAAADVVILTSDNPRSEDPEAILADIAAGITRPPAGGVRTIPDRRRAIQTAVAEAREGDVIIIAGKGHETYQIFADRTIDFDDRQVAAEALAARAEADAEARRR